ncbi:MAG: hypothetical protein U1E87_06015 [Alphaproteobacteria bacterium]
MTPATYSNFADNTMALRPYATTVSAQALTIDDKSKFDPQCRLAAPIQASGDRTPAQFVLDAFNDELKFAGVFGQSDTSRKIRLTLDKARFSSMAGLTRGWWEFGLTLANESNGVTYSVSDHYKFQSGFDAMTACKQTAEAMTPAVQHLIYQAVSSPEFAKLMK